MLIVRLFCLVCYSLVLRLFSDHIRSVQSMCAVVFLWVVSLSSDIQRVSGWCLWMKYHEVAEPIEASSLYSDAPLFSFGFGVQFNVGDFLRPVYA